MTHTKETPVASVTPRWDVLDFANSLPHIVYSFVPGQAGLEFVNDRWLEYTGQSREEALSGGANEAVHPEDRGRTEMLWRRSLTDGVSYEDEIRIRARTGEYGWFLVRSNPVRNKAGTVVRWVGTSTDISERRRRDERLHFLNTASQALAASLEVTETLRTIVRQAVPKLADWCSLYLPDERGDLQLVEVVHPNPHRLELVTTLLRDYPTDPDNPSSSQGVYRTGQSVFVPEISDSVLQAAAKDKRHLALLRGLELGSVLTVPLTAGGSVVGVLGLGTSLGSHGLQPEDVTLAEELGRRAGVALAHAKVYQKLRDSEAQLRLVTDGMPALVSYVDNERRYQFVNKGYSQWFGHGLEEIRGKYIWDVLGEAAYAAEKPDVDKALRGEAVTFERQVPYKNGGTRYVQATYLPDRSPTGEVKGYFALIVDLSERRRLETSLKETSERLELGLTAARAGWWDWNIAEGTHHYSAGFETLLGFAPGTFPGGLAAFLARVHPEDYERIAAVAKNTPSSHYQRPSEQEYRVVVGGEVHWILSRCRVERDRAGTPVRVFGVDMDITERKRAEEALREADKRKDEFLAVLAHELRNPLAPIRMSLEVMKRTTSEEVLEEAKAVIERQTNQLVTLVDDLLDVSRITQGRVKLNMEKVDLREVVELALESTRPLIQEREHDVQVSLPAKKVELYGDKTRIAQVLLNLLNNAAKYTEKGGKISLRAELENAQVLIRVQDTGLGIPQEKLPHIFELFGRLERDVSREGLGIGLSLVKRLVELHGGSIEAYSAGTNQGSEFTVRLPVVETVTEEIQTAQRLPTMTEEQRKVRCVLIIDDYESNRKMMARLVRLMGHEVVTASHGEEGLETLKNYKADLILCDVNMPGMSGFEVAQRIRANPPQHPFKLVALTGYGQEEDIRRTKEAGFDAHLVKPVEMRKLEDLLNPEA